MEVKKFNEKWQTACNKMEAHRNFKLMILTSSNPIPLTPKDLPVIRSISYADNAGVSK